jgi:hypothetical protein
VQHPHERSGWAGQAARWSLPAAVRAGPLGGYIGKSPEPQIVLKTDQRTILLELGLGGKFLLEWVSCSRNPEVQNTPGASVAWWDGDAGRTDVSKL